MLRSLYRFLNLLQLLLQGDARMSCHLAGSESLCVFLSEDPSGKGFEH